MLIRTCIVLTFEASVYVTPEILLGGVRPLLFTSLRGH